MLHYETGLIILSNFSAHAAANAGSLMCRSSSITSTPGATQLRTLWNSAASASGHQNDLPSASIADTPRSGSSTRRRAVRGARLLGDLLAELVHLLRRRAHQRDGRVVLVEAPALVLLGHRLRRAEVDHVERPDRDHLRHPLSAAAVRRSGPADSTPPASSSASSVVVMSSTPAMSPSRISPSIVRPPVPVAWKTSTS